MRRAPTAALAALRAMMEGRTAIQVADTLATSASAEGRATSGVLANVSAVTTSLWQPPLRASYSAAAAVPAASSRLRARVLHRRPTSARHRERMPVDPYTRAPVTYVQLLQHIRQAPDVRALEALVDAHAARFDAVHAAAALSVLPRLAASAVERPTPESSRRPALLLARLQGLAVQHAGSMHARQIANVVWSAGRCRPLVSAASRDEQRRAVGAARLPASALLQAAQQEEAEAEQQQQQQQGRQEGGGRPPGAAVGDEGAAAATSPSGQLLALERERGRARLRQQRDQARAPRWRGDAAGAAQALLPTSPDLDAGPMTTSRAAVRELLRELGRGGFRKLYQGGTPADAAQLLHGLARLRVVPPPSLSRHLQAFVAKRSGEFDARHLAVTTWALARLAGLEREQQQQQQRGQRQGQGQPRPYRRRAEGLAAALPGPLAEVLVARALQQANFLRPWSMCALLYAFARPPPPSKKRGVQEKEAEGREEENAVAAAAPAADHRALGRALAEGLASGVVAECDARAPTPQQTAMLAWAYGRLRVWGNNSSVSSDDDGNGGDAAAAAAAAAATSAGAVAAALSRCALDSLEAFGPTDLSLLVSGLAESAAAGAREAENGGAPTLTSPSSFALPADVVRLLDAVAAGIAGEAAVRVACAEDASRLLRGYAALAGKGLYPPAPPGAPGAQGLPLPAGAPRRAEALEGMALRLAGGAAAHARSASPSAARELAALLPRLLLRRGGGGSRRRAAEAGGDAGDDGDDGGSPIDVAAATADLARAADEVASGAGAAGGQTPFDNDSGDDGGGFAHTEAADLLDALADAHADGRGPRGPDAALLAALLSARSALALPPHDALCRQAASALAALAGRVQEDAGGLAAASDEASAAAPAIAPSSPLLRPLELATDLAVGLAEARRLGAESGAAAARAALAASAAAAEPKPKLRTLARLCRALSSDVAVMQQPPVRSLLEACAGPLDAAVAAGALPAGAASSAAVALARAQRHGHSRGAAASRELVLRLIEAAASAPGGASDAHIARDLAEARALLGEAPAA